MKYDDYVNELKEQTVKRVTKSLTKKLLKKYIWLSWGPFPQLLALVLPPLLEVIVNETEIAVFFLYIDFRVDDQGREFYEALVNNIETRVRGTPEERRDAEENLKNAFRNFVKLTN